MYARDVKIPGMKLHIQSNFSGLLPKFVSAIAANNCHQKNV